MFNETLTTITRTLHEDLCTFVIIFRSVLLRMMFQTKIVQKIGIHIFILHYFYPKIVLFVR